MPSYQVIDQAVPVTFRYPVCFTAGVFAPENPLLAEVIGREARVLAVVDSGVAAHHPGLHDAIRAYACTWHLTLVAPPMEVPGGEAVKNDPALIERLHAAINAGGVCRHSYVVAIGGGAVLDAVGYAAATAHRGVRLIRMPTTVLAQNDSGVGVKNGVNAFGKKNFLGCFAPPFAVINDSDFLATLATRDWRSGIAEAVKVALIKDAAFFADIEADAERLVAHDTSAMRRLIHRCAELHLQHIGQGGDAFERGTSRPLDFGHWAAHRLEHLTDYRLRHGEAVAIGTALDCTYSTLEGRLNEPMLERVLSTLECLGFELYVPELEERLNEPEHPRSLFRGLREFREHLGGELTLILLEHLGQGVEVHEVNLALYRQAVQRLRQRVMGPRAAEYSAG